MIKKIIQAAAVMAVCGASAAANADTFDFSYTFADNLEVIGTFTGTAGTDSGGALTATDISNIQLSFNGSTFTGGASPTLILNAWNPNGTTTTTYNGVTTTTQGAFVAPGASTTIYANAAENNFGISDVDQSASSSATNPTYFFNFVTAPAAAAQVIAYNANTGDLDLDATPTSWKLTDTSPVPVPAALPLLLSGLGLLGAARRRRAV